MTLKDAFDLTHKSRDYITKLWAAYSVVTLAVVAWFAGNNTSVECEKRITAILFYFVFVGPIFWLLRDAYRELVAHASELTAAVETDKPRSQKLTTYSKQFLANAERKQRIMLTAYVAFSVFALFYIVVLVDRPVILSQSAVCAFFDEQ